MAKIFDLISDTHESPNRNTFDLKHKRHMTGKAGVITPFLVLPHVPSDSFEIDTAIGANLMPMWYPTQSNMRFIVHFFDVPYRLLQKNWKNMLEGLIDENFPYMDVPSTYWKTGSLADYLGVPTTISFPENFQFLPRTCAHDQNFYFYGYSDLASYDHRTNKGAINVHSPNTDDGVDDTNVGISFTSVFLSPTRLAPLAGNKIWLPIYRLSTITKYSVRITVFDAKDLLDEDGHFIQTRDGLGDPFVHITPSLIKYCVPFPESEYSPNGDFPAFTGTSFEVDRDAFNAAVGDCKYPCLCVEVDPVIGGNFYKPLQIFQMSSQAANDLGYWGAAGTIMDVGDFTAYSPYYSTRFNNVRDVVKVSAFAFRAYDMLYNSYYRNSQGNQPFVVNNQVQYNNYLRTDADGADNNEYELKSRNWELDAYTSCLPSPQQGDAPVVAVNSLGRMTITDEDGTTSTLDLRDLPDGEPGIEVRNADIANPEHARMAMRVASSGLSIEDFRQGNALQRFLEQSLRSGYRYADFIFGHFGTAPKHQELDMPVFIGGYTQVVDTSKISNVSASGDAPLGQFAGVGSSFGGSGYKIKHFCDDFGLILGVMMLVPDAAYSQVLPKHFLYNSRLDFYFPEFSQLGMQAITYEELCPIQSHKHYVDGDTDMLLTDTFGYQRPNHEYVYMPDTLHGLFRTSLNGSVVNRVFGDRPTLGDDFLRIKPEEVNDIFSLVENNDDIYIAQVVCDIKATRPIPRVVIPSLGR